MGDRRKTLLIAFATFTIFLLVAVLGCRGWPEVNTDVKELRSLHAVYRDNTVPKNPSDTAKVVKLGEKIDSIMAHMEELTR